MPIRTRLLQFAPLTLAALAVLAPGGTALATPRYVRPAPAPDGRYGKLEGHELIGFKVQNRKVTDFFFSMDMQCHDSESGEDFVRNFTGHDLGGGRASREGSWKQNYTQVDGGREGSGLAEVTFTHNRGVYGSVSVVTTAGPESSEDCHGFIDFKMNRGPLG
jgi:hypothetical protein